jgi:hypothetical protein
MEQGLREIRVKLARDRRQWLLASTAILLVAFAARVIWLDRHPLWWDEGLNVYFAHQSLTDLVAETRITHDANPPLYRLTLGRWIDLVGSTAFTLRLLSVVMGVSTVALALTLGRWLLSQRAALLGALLVALAPMQVYYGREAKSYALATALAMVSTYVWARKLGYLGGSERSRGAIQWWGIYVISTAAVIGTHYYLGLLVFWQGLWVVGECLWAYVFGGREVFQNAVGQLLRWVLAMTAVALLLTPWVLIVFDTTTEMVTGVSENEPLSLGGYLVEVGNAFGGGPGEGGTVSLIAGLVLADLGLFGLLHIPSGRRRAFVLTWIAVPVAAAYALQLAFSFFSPRFLLHLGPPIYLLAAAGVLRLGQRVRAVGSLALVAVILAAWGVSLCHHYTQPPVAPDIGRISRAEDPRPALAQLRQLARPNDALAYVYIWQVGYIHAYYPQNELVFYRAHYTPGTVRQELKGIFDSHTRLWRLGYRLEGRSPALARSWLEAVAELNAYRVESTTFGRHRLTLYVSPSFQTPGVKVSQGTASFGKRIKLTYPTVEAQLKPGDVVALPLEWQALTELDEDYKVFVHLGLPNRPPLVQEDSRPRNNLSPTAAWAAGETVVDRRALLLPATIPPGDYQVRVGLYRASDGARLPIVGTDGQDALVLGHVEVRSDASH